MTVGVEMSASQNSTRERRADIDRFGPYQVVEKLASGGMAEIYKVRHPERPSGFYALKCIRSDCTDDPQFKKMLIDEAKIVSRLRHENINRVIDVVNDDGQIGLILEHVDGVDLGRLKKHLRDANRELPLELAVHIVRRVLEGLDYAHNAKDETGEYLNIVHRDVSPGNVMVDVKGGVQLVDFGIAVAQNRLAKTEAGNVKGKFRYMSPEQIKGDPVGPRADIYATAVLLWELLSGKRVFDDCGMVQLMIRVANAHVPSLEEARPGLPKALFKVYERATQLNAQDRYASARAFADALDSVLTTYDVRRCKRGLAELVTLARTRDERLRFDQAVARARYAAEHDLENAILSALEQPDRVERVDPRSARRVEGSAVPAPVLPVDPEPPTAPMSAAPPPGL